MAETSQNYMSKKIETSNCFFNQKDTLKAEQIERHVIVEEYGFDKHKGYPTKEHIENVKKYGLLDNYRFTFNPISDLIKQGGKFEKEIRQTNN